MGVVHLVRHGQASFGARDYDQLSELGYEQAWHCGSGLAGVGLRPAVVVSGSLRRHRQTAAALLAAAGWPAGLETDEGWNEYDHEGLAATSGGRGDTDSRRFQDHLEIGMRNWAAGSATDGEAYDGFCTRVTDALERVATRLGPGQDAVVISSGGVIGWLAATLLGGNVEQWLALNRVCVNGGITKLIRGRRGTSLVSFNEHSHIPGDQVTYR